MYIEDKSQLSWIGIFPSLFNSSIKIINLSVELSFFKIGYNILFPQFPYLFDKISQIIVRVCRDWLINEMESLEPEEGRD